MKPRTRTEYSILNISTGILGYIINTIAGFACRIVFIRCLSVDYLGVSGLFSNILSVLSLAELGVGSAIGYALYKPLAENDEKKVAALLGFYKKAYIIIGIIIGIIGIAIYPFVGEIIREPPNIKENIGIIYLLFLFSTVSSYFFSYRIALLQKAQQSYIVVSGSYLQSILQCLCQIIYLLLTHKYYGYLIIQIVGSIVYNFGMSEIAEKKHPYIIKYRNARLEKEEINKIGCNVRDIIVSKISGILVNNTDNIIITYLNGITATGLTSNYTLLTRMLSSLIGQVFEGITASVGNHNVLSTVEEREKMFNNINFLNFWLYGWATVGIICVSTDLVSLCFGTQYTMNILIPIALAINVYMVGMQDAVWTYKSTLGIFKQGRFVNFFTAGLNIFFSIILGKLWGVFGVLFASAISRALTNTWYSPYCVYKYGFNKSVRGYAQRYFRYFIIIIISCVCSYLLCKMVRLPLLLSVLAKILLCSIIFNTILVVLYKNHSEFKFLISKINAIIKRKI